VSKKRSASTGNVLLPFEKELADLQAAIEAAETEEDKAERRRVFEETRTKTYAELTAWQRIQLARHPQRPRMLDYTSRVLDDLVELHGDRAVGDDPAMVCGIGRFQGETVFVMGQQKGIQTDEKVRRNFGMAHPEGYRKAMRMMRLAERYGFPVLSFVDTPAAHPGIEAERFGQGPIIAQSMMTCLELKTPIFSAILSEGGSGGALAIAVGDWVTMFEYAMYVICPPERCAEILWRDVEQKELAASAMRVSAPELFELGALDSIMPEADGGAHRAPDAAAAVLSEEIAKFLHGCRQGQWTPEKRQAKFRAMGHFLEAAPAAAAEPADTDGD